MPIGLGKAYGIWKLKWRVHEHPKSWTAVLGGMFRSFECWNKKQIELKEHLPVISGFFQTKKTLGRSYLKPVKTDDVMTILRSYFFYFLIIEVVCKNPGGIKRGELFFSWGWLHCGGEWKIVFSTSLPKEIFGRKRKKIFGEDIRVRGKKNIFKKWKETFFYKEEGKKDDWTLMQ